VDEAVAISKVVQFINSPDYAHFSRIVFDTAPTGHTLRLLTLPDFLDASLGEAPPRLAVCFPWFNLPACMPAYVLCAFLLYQCVQVAAGWVKAGELRGMVACRQDRAVAAEAGGRCGHCQGPVWREEGAGLGGPEAGKVASMCPCFHEPLLQTSATVCCQARSADKQEIHMRGQLAYSCCSPSTCVVCSNQTGAERQGAHAGSTQARMEQARAVFRDAEATEFVVVTIPTVMAAAESVRLVAALRKEQVPVHALLVNQARPCTVPCMRPCIRCLETIGGCGRCI